VPLLALFLWRFRRRVPPALFFAACSTGQIGPPPARSCTVDADCSDTCPPGQVGSCATSGMMSQCVCTADIPIGPIGPWMSMAAVPAGPVWVSAYNQLHGDLMVAKLAAARRLAAPASEVADRVPARPGGFVHSHLRGGVAAGRRP